MVMLLTVLCLVFGPALATADVAGKAHALFDRLIHRGGNTVGQAPGDPTQHPNWNLLDDERCGNSAADRIIGGRNAALGEKPWLARVGYSGPKMPEISYRCGGAILNKNTIITAAHCVTGLPSGIAVAAVQVGEHNTKTNPDCEEGVCAEPVQTYKPKEIITHKEYNAQPFKNDIALVRIEDMRINAFASPICMMKGPLLTKNYVGTDAEVAGWGIYDIEEPQNSDILLTVQLKVEENERCIEAYAKHAPIGPTQMCVGGVVGKDSCGGDSGGPLMQVEAVDGPPRTYLIGIVSFGSKKCGASTMPGIYTRITSYLDWVMDNLKESKINYKVV